MKFLLDAQLPKKVSLFLQYKGYDSVHTLELPKQNRTKDSEINNVSIEEKRVVVSKDKDFVESLLLSDQPYKLLYINTGNINNKQLQGLFTKNLEQIISLLSDNRFIELTHDAIITHN